MTSGPFRDFLAAAAPSLNRRFLRLRRRYPQLDPRAALALVAECLEPLAGEGEEGTPTLLASVFDLVLIHAGRGLLAPGGGSHAGLGILLREAFPRLRRLLLSDPRSLPGALSNAVENLGPRGADMARGLVRTGDQVRDGRQLLDAGVVLAWRLGEARLRERALDIAPGLPARALLAALALDGWPEAAAPLAVTALAADGWRRPDGLFTEKTLEGIALLSAERLKELERALAAEPAAPLADWRLAGRAGGFSGFDGSFDEPPLLLAESEPPARHRFWVRAGAATFRIDADAFGSVVRPGEGEGWSPAGGKGPRHPALARAATCVAGPRHLAFTAADSFHVRILAPAWKPL